MMSITFKKIRLKIKKIGKAITSKKNIYIIILKLVRKKLKYQKNCFLYYT